MGPWEFLHYFSFLLVPGVLLPDILPTLAEGVAGPAPKSCVSPGMTQH